MKSKYFFPQEFRTNLNCPSELPQDMVRYFVEEYYIDKYDFYMKARVCKLKEDEEVKDWYLVTHLTLHNRFDIL